MLRPVTPAAEKRLRIGQVARQLGVEPYVLRFWEEEFPQLQAARTTKGAKPGKAAASKGRSKAKPSS